MELLETARVDAFCKDDIIVPAGRRNSVLCVVWEGTCVELERSSVSPNSFHAPSMRAIQENDPGKNMGAVWYAGDWTGPIALQPEKSLSGESDLSATHNVVAMSSQGVKVSLMLLQIPCLANQCPYIPLLIKSSGYHC